MLSICNIKPNLVSSAIALPEAPLLPNSPAHAACCECPTWGRGGSRELHSKVHLAHIKHGVPLSGGPVPM